MRGSFLSEDRRNGSECSKYRTGKDDDILKDLQILIRSRYGLIHLDTIEEDRSESLLKHLADSLNLPFYTWTIARGLRRPETGQGWDRTADAEKALDHVQSTEASGIYHFQSLGPFLEETVIRAKLSHIARWFSQESGAVILTGADVVVPETARPYAAVASLPPPTRQDYAELLHYIYRDLSKSMDVRLQISKKDFARLLDDLRGLTLLEAEKVLTKAIIVDGRLGSNDIRYVLLAKKDIIEREGLLEYFPVEETMTEIADLEVLKTWLGKRKCVIEEPSIGLRSGLPFPKGILLLGVPGSGKSLCAKAVAMEWKMPLLKMDPSNLYNKYIGETEKNFKRAMEAAEKMAPIVLWIDEVEKIFATGDQEDGGVSQRVLGMFLTWMQDRKERVFVVATSNDVLRLPSEFLRKGRFDEIFFLDLPNPEVRRAIFEIHLRRRGSDPETFDLAALADATEGFSGAEIEQAIVSGLYSALSQDVTLNNELLLLEIKYTRPLSVTRAEDIQQLKEWTRGRAVNAADWALGGEIKPVESETGEVL